MKTASVIASLSRNAGGLFESVRRLHQSLAEIPNVRVNVLGLRDKFTDADMAAWSPLNVRTFTVLGPPAFGYAPGLQQDMLELDEDILHTHGIWMYPSVATRDWHRKTGRPYLISPHGMLDPWAVKNSAWKKKLALFFYEREHLENAACLRALCESEANAMRAFGLKNPICIIPNGIDIPEVRSQESGVSGLKFDGHKVLLYLGRIHPKKGLVNLIKAWAATINSQASTLNTWTLAIAGWDQNNHEQELKGLSKQLGIQNSVKFLGPKFDEEKAVCYQDCDAFILPSFSEGLPMVVLEAWAYGKPVLMTQECNLPEGFAANAAFRIEPNAESIAAGLQELFRTTNSGLQMLGNNGRALVAEKFAWSKIAADMRAVYEWILGGGIKPDCVV